MIKNKTIVVPSYWGEANSTISHNERRIFDHPTPLDESGTLPRFLDSLEIIDMDKFTLVVIAVANDPDINDDVRKKLERLLEPYRDRYDISLLHAQNLKLLREEFVKSGLSSTATDLMNLDNYASVRNMCSLAGILNKSELTIFIDDDEVFTDPDFLRKAGEFVGTVMDGEPVHAVAGFYLQPDTYYIRENNPPAWRKQYWDKTGIMNEAFDLFIGKPPRLKPTPFVFGGNMVVHLDALMRVPFDPKITRGEDIDFLINLKINGITFWLDNELSIKHLPPEKPHPEWKKMREDIKRFLYDRKKILDHADHEGLNIKSFMPYPGKFLGPGLEESIIKASEMLKKEYEKQGQEHDAKECDVNIQLVKDNFYNQMDTRSWLSELTQNWQMLASMAVGRRDVIFG